MAFIKDFAGQNWLLPPSIADTIQDEDSICFLVDFVVESMDFGKINRGYGGPGHPAYRPEIMTKLHVQAAIDKQRSSRAIAKNVRTNVVYMFLAGRTTPDFRTMSDFRKNNPEIIKQAFKETIKLARNLKITNLGHLSIDGTKIKANASNSSTLKIKDLEDIERYISVAIEEGIAKDEEEDAVYGYSFNR